jgi:hypothetical protein
MKLVKETQLYEEYVVAYVVKIVRAAKLGNSGIICRICSSLRAIGWL